MTSRAGGMGAETPLPSTGRLEGASVPEILRLAGDAALTGSLVFEREGIQKVLYLRDGRVVFAASRDPEDRLGTLLLRRGQVGLVPLLEATGEIASGRRLGQILIEHGVMSPDDVARAVLDQVREIALSVFSWRHGEWRISPVALPGDEPLTLDLGAEELILVGVRHVRDWRWIRQSVGGPRAVYRAATPQPDGEPTLTLTERSILERLDAPLRIDELCDQVYAPSYDIYRSVWALTILGRLVRVDPRRVERRANRPEEGWLDASGGAAGLLLELGEKRFSGVVRLFSGGTEGSVFLRDGRIAFATTRDPEQGLLSHLLRRGVISDRDHEEAVRRLISGKRVGTLLAERGAIDSEEVATFVREQVLDVAKSLVMLDDGEYEIEEGLPSQEDILLDRAPEEIILAAVEASERFQAVWRSFRDLNVLFRLTPGHLARLDRMQVRPLVWDVVALLAEERTLRELLAARSEPDFEICRLLHGLERTRIVTRVSHDEILRRARMAIQEMSREHDAPAGNAVGAPAAEVVVDDDLPLATAGDTDDGSVVFDSGSGQDGNESETHHEAFDAPDAYEEDDARDEAGTFDVDASHVDDDAPDDDAAYEADASSDPYDLHDPIEVHEADEPEVDDDRVVHGSGDPDAADSRTAAEIAPELFPAGADEGVADLAEGADDTDRADLADEAATADGADEDHGGESDHADPAETDEGEPAGADPAATVEMSREAVEAAIAAEGGPSADAAAEADEPWGEANPPADGEDADGVAEEAAAGPVETAGEPEAAAAEDGGAVPVPGEDDDTDILGIDPFIYEVVDRFNERHAIVYSGLRPEIGAGIRNYVATCCGRLGEHRRAFENVEIGDDGRFDRESLARALSEVAPHDPAAPLDALIRGEIETVRGFVAAARIDRIEAALAERD